MPQTPNEPPASAVALVLQFTLRLLIFSALLAFAHDLIVGFTALSLSRENLFAIYIFLAALTFLVFLLVQWLARVNYERAGMAYLATGFLKMMASVVFLLPEIRMEEPPKSYILQFMAAFLLFLAFEAVVLFKLLRQYDPKG